MQPAPHPENETLRIAALHALGVLDTEPEPAFDALVRVASLICGVPISLISLVDTERQWFKANEGLHEASETARDIAFCSHAILEDDVFEVADALKDLRFVDNPLVTGNPGIRFYAGAPLILSDGSRVGTLCVIDRVPRQMNDMQREVLRCLARAAVQALEGRHGIREANRISSELRDSEAWFRALSDGSPHGVFYTDLQGACTYTNPKWQDIYGLTSQQSLGRGWMRGMRAGDKARLYELWTAAVKDGVDVELEYAIDRPDGTVRQLHARAIMVKGPGGTVVGSLGSVQDITERKLREESLRTSKAMLDRTGKLAGVGGWEVDLGANQIFWSDQTCRIHGLEPGQPIHPDELPQHGHYGLVGVQPAGVKDAPPGRRELYSVKGQDRKRLGHHAVNLSNSALTAWRVCT